MKVFYSWQSWTSRRTNWDFIQDCIAAAIERVNSDLNVELAIDHDIKERTGSINIADAVRLKIDECLIFVCDITFVATREDKSGDETKRRYSPNPNVMHELGYAVKVIGWDNVICVANEAYGPIREMPFDIYVHNKWSYSLAEDDDEDKKEQERVKLTNELYDQIRGIVQGGALSVSYGERAEVLLSEGKDIELDKLITATAKQGFDEFTSREFYQQRQEILQGAESETSALSEEMANLYYEKSEPLLEVMARLGFYGTDDQAKYVVRVIQRWLENTRRPNEIDIIWRFFPATFLIYGIGIAATYEGKWEFLSAALTEPRMRWVNRAQEDSPFPEKMMDAFFDPIQKVSNEHGWLSRFLEGAMRPVIEPLIPSEEEYHYAFDLFEMLLALVCLDMIDVGYEWMPEHQVYIDRRSHNSLKDFWADAGKAGPGFTLLQAGLFGSNSSRLYAALKQYPMGAGWCLYKKKTLPGQGSSSPRFAEIYNENRPDKIIWAE